MLKIRDLKAKIDNKDILKGLNLEIKPGEVHAIMGPNGSGKSTLSNVLSGKKGYKISGDVIYENKNLLDLAIEEVFSTLTASEIVDRLDAAQIANARMNGVAEFAEHPQLKARGRWREIQSSVGLIRATIPPATIDGVEPRMEKVPEVGANTDSILRELGYTKDVVTGWRKSGIV